VSETLDELLARWRAHPSAELADELDARSAEALETFRPPRVQPEPVPPGAAPYHRTYANAAAFQKEFEQAAEQPDAITTAWLLANLGTKVPDGSLEDRIELIVKRAPDPRIARRFAEAIAQQRLPMSDEVYGPMIQVLAASGDARQIPILERALASPKAKTVHARDFFAKRLPKVIERLRRAGPAPASTPRKAKAAELLARILAHPDDDEARLVYADALQDAGDPRGEMILLQLRGADAQKLIRAHQDEWLGDLARIGTNAIFRRGFLSSIDLRRSSAAPKALWERCVADPLLATVEELHQGYGTATRYRAFAASPAMRSLRRVEATDQKTLDALGKGARTFEHVDLDRSTGIDRTRPAWAKLRSIGVSGTYIDDAVMAGSRSIVAGDDLEGFCLVGTEPLWNPLHYLISAPELWRPGMKWLGVRGPGTRATLRRVGEKTELRVVGTTAGLQEIAGIKWLAGRTIVSLAEEPAVGALYGAELEILPKHELHRIVHGFI
jgi:uncharacterized protein (TIGR02996 family)